MKYTTMTVTLRRSQRAPTTVVDLIDRTILIVTMGTAHITTQRTDFKFICSTPTLTACHLPRQYSCSQQDAYLFYAPELFPHWDKSPLGCHGAGRGPIPMRPADSCARLSTSHAPRPLGALQLWLLLWLLMGYWMAMRVCRSNCGCSSTGEYTCQCLPDRTR